MADWMTRTHAIPLARLPRRFLAQIAPLGGSVNAVEPARLEDICQAARVEKSAILFYLSESDGYSVWLQRPDGSLISTHIDDPQPLISKLFERLPYVQNGRQSHKSKLSTSKASLGHINIELHRIYEVLFPPIIRDSLPSDSNRLTIVADGILEFVPFCALRTHDKKYLIEKYEITYWPSVTAWSIVTFGPRKYTSPENSSNALILGNPDASLPDSEEEAQMVAALLNVSPLLQKEATLNAVLTAAKGICVLHLATHGILIEEMPEFSFLTLADQPLTVNLLYNLDAGIRADLVVLSACQTGLGFSHPDSMISLANAFLIAGANTVVATLWRVLDDSTKLIIERFYNRLILGDDIAASLRKAQLEILGDWETRHPDHWAAFKVVGSRKNPLDPKST